jgi:hypothetical protein
MPRSGYIYVLVHPSAPDLYKIGVTTRKPSRRLAEHNTNYDAYAGRIVKETGQKWELKEFHAVPDVYWAESAFWGTTHFPLIPYRFGVEVEKMTCDMVERGLGAAKAAGIRPKRREPQSEDMPNWVNFYTASVRKRLEGRRIKLLGQVRSIVSGRSDFLCENGHKWRTRPILVAEGEGCPDCGLGEDDPEEIKRRIGAGTVCLLKNPEKPGFVGVGVIRGGSDDDVWGDWVDHRYRKVENVTFAESVLWDLLGRPLPHDRKPIKMDLKKAEEFFRNLTSEIHERVTLIEIAKANSQKGKDT